MAKHIYMCNDCYNNHKPVGHIFFTAVTPDPDKYKNQCPMCDQHNMIQLNLDSEEGDFLIQFSNDPDFILAMDKLKSEDIIEFNIKMSQLKQSTPQPLPQTSETDNIPKCPTCGSTNIKKISGGKRWLTTGIFGLGSGDALKSYECLNCQYKW